MLNYQYRVGSFGCGYQQSTNTLPMHHVFNKVFTNHDGYANHDWYELVKTNALFYTGKTLAISRYYSLVIIGKSLVEITVWKL